MRAVRRIDLNHRILFSRFINTMPGRSGRTCAVIGCHNSSGKLQILKKGECSEHKPLLWEECPCLIPYGLHRFPGRAEDAAIRQQWIKNINRKDFIPNNNSTVCGIHFMDGKPTKENPYPVLHLGYEYCEEEGELADQSEKPTLPSQLNESKQEDTATTLVKAPVVWSPLTVKEEEGEIAIDLEKPSLPSQLKESEQKDTAATLVNAPEVWSPLTVKNSENDKSNIKEEEGELVIQSEKPMLPGQQNEIKQADTAATQVKAPVVWSPLTVKAAVSKLSGVQNVAKVVPPAPTLIKQEEGSDSLPRKTVAWSPLTVQAAVNRLSAIQHDQPTQPRAVLLGKRPAGNAVTSTISLKQSKEEPSIAGKREIKVVQTGRHHRSKVLQGPWHRVGDNLVRGRFKRLPKAIMEVPGFKDIMVAEVLKVLEKECEALTSLTFNSVLRENNPMFLKDFCWEKVIKEWKTEAPTFLKFLQHASKVFENPAADQTHMAKGKSLPMAMGGALLLRARSSAMCAPMYINSMILEQGGTKKKCFGQLNRVGVCVSHHRMQLRLKDVDTTQGSELARWEEELGETEEMDTTSEDSDEETRGSTYEEGDSDVPEITYIVS